MKNHFLTLLILASGLLTGICEQSCAESAPVSIETSLDHMEVDIGDVVTLTVTLTCDTNVAVSLPKPDKKFGAFEMFSQDIADPVQGNSGAVTHSAEYRLWALETGEHAVPTIEIPFMRAGDSLPGFVYSPEVIVRVHSVVGEGVDSAEIKPLIAPLEDPLGVSPLYEESRGLWYALAGLSLVLALALWWAFRKKQESEKILDSRPAWEKALERLANLSANSYLSDELYKEYYSELTATFKEYLGRLFEYPALDMTTRELLDACDADTITKPNTETLKEILSRADMIKFARALPPQEIPEKDFQDIYEMVQVIKEEYQERERQLRLEHQRREEARKATERSAKSAAQNKEREPENV